MCIRDSAKLARGVNLVGSKTKAIKDEINPSDRYGDPELRPDGVKYDRPGYPRDGLANIS